MKHIVLTIVVLLLLAQPITARTPQLEDVQYIQLSPGQNLISINIMPADTSIDSVFAGIPFRRVMGEYGSFDATIPPQFNTLSDIYPGNGYIVTIDQPATLVVAGTLVPFWAPIRLHPGWNWIGYYPQRPMKTDDALAGIAGLYGRVQDEAGNPMNRMYPGRGYFIYMTQGANLVYPY